MAELTGSAKPLLCDLTGYHLTCGSDEALSWFNKATFAYTTVRENGLPMLYKALELDDSIVLAHCVLVWTHVFNLQLSNITT